MLEFLKSYWQYILTGCQTLSIICLTFIVYIKNRRAKLLEIVECAIEEAEKLGGTSEQKKIYAMAIIKSQIKASDKKISSIIESFITFSKNVNAKRNKTIQEVLSNEFKESNE